MLKKRCDFCDKEIKAFTEKQLEYLILQHILSKHREKIKIEGKEDEGL